MIPLTYRLESLYLKFLTFTVLQLPNKMEVEKMNYDITDEQVVKRVRAAVKLEIERRFAMDLPVSYYDPVTDKIYQKYNDGRIEEIKESELEVII